MSTILFQLAAGNHQADQVHHQSQADRQLEMYYHSIFAP